MKNLPTLRILIVDDERFIRSTIRASLRIIGHFDIAEAADGETALREVGTHRPDLILCDIRAHPKTLAHDFNALHLLT